MVFELLITIYFPDLVLYEFKLKVSSSSKKLAGVDHHTNCTGILFHFAILQYFYHKKQFDYRVGNTSGCISYGFSNFFPSF